MEEPVKCPVCGKYAFEHWNDMDFCDLCGWCNDAIQNENPDYRGGANSMSLNEARKAYKEGKPIY